MPHDLPSDELTIEYLITRQFSSSDEFSLFIEEEALRRKITNYEMVVEYCEEKNIDVISISSMVSDRLKDLIRVEAEERNLMKRKMGKLPL